MMESGIYRAADACLNRALEGIRTCEDLCRFSTAAGGLASELKVLRHRAAEAAGIFSYERLLAARDVSGDQVKFSDTPGEKKRRSSAEIAAAGIKRSQQAFRSLEEFSKLISGLDNNLFQQIRFESYDIEKRLIPLLMAGDRASMIRGALYGVLDSAFVADGNYAAAAMSLARGGAGVVQLRMKGAPGREVLAAAMELGPLLRELGVLFIVNDHPDVALLSGADGIHLGAEDIPCSEARKIVPPGMIIGVSTRSVETARAALDEGPDYIAVGPVFGTASKGSEPLAPVGLGLITEVKKMTSLPVVAIGGITSGNLQSVLEAGADSPAVISSLFINGDIEGCCGAMTRILRDFFSPEAPGGV